MEPENQEDHDALVNSEAAFQETLCYYCGLPIREFPMLLKPGTHSHEHCYSHALEFLRRLHKALEKWA